MIEHRSGLDGSLTRAAYVQYSNLVIDNDKQYAVPMPFGGSKMHFTNALSLHRRLRCQRVALGRRLQSNNQPVKGIVPAMSTLA